MSMDGCRLFSFPFTYSLSVQVPSWKVQRAAINGALALEVLLNPGKAL